MVHGCVGAPRTAVRLIYRTVSRTVRRCCCVYAAVGAPVLLVARQVGKAGFPCRYGNTTRFGAWSAARLARVNCMRVVWLDV